MILPGILDKKRARGGGAQQSMDSANSHFDSLQNFSPFEPDIPEFHQRPQQIPSSPNSAKSQVHQDR